MMVAVVCFCLLGEAVDRLTVLLCSHHAMNCELLVALKVVVGVLQEVSLGRAPLLAPQMHVGHASQRALEPAVFHCVLFCACGTSMQIRSTESIDARTFCRLKHVS